MSHPKIEIYSKPICPYCVTAKKFLETKGYTFETIDIQADPARREEMIQRANGRMTVPQIFINGVHIGGCDDMLAMDQAGTLAKHLEGPAS